jgi:hypothetical protein
VSKTNCRTVQAGEFDMFSTRISAMVASSSGHRERLIQKSGSWFAYKMKKSDKEEESD